MQIGTADADPGELDRGSLEVAELPTATPERVPVIVANGAENGPVVWLHGSIHGDEATGLAVAQDAVDEIPVEELGGTVVSIPNVNPAGLRRNQRTSYYHDDDPNRFFPGDDESVRPPRQQELIDTELFDLLTEHADVLIDLHTAGVNSMPFLIRNRVSYGTHRTADDARELSAEISRLADAFGLPVVTTYDRPEKEEVGLDRSTTNAVTNEAGIPAITPELGSHSVVEERNRRAGVLGVENVLRELDMLPGDPVPNEHAPDPPVSFPVKRSSEPRADRPGIARYRVEAGDVVADGDPIADIVAPNGSHRSTVRAVADGYVIGRREGAAVYENDSLVSMVVRDEAEELIVKRDE